MFLSAAGHGWEIALFSVVLDKLKDLLDRLFEIAGNAESCLNAGPNAPALQSRHIRAAHLEPKRQLGFFNPFRGEALGQSVCHFVLHLPGANMASFTVCEQHEINKV